MQELTAMFKCPKQRKLVRTGVCKDCNYFYNYGHGLRDTVAEGDYVVECEFPREWSDN